MLNSIDKARAERKTKLQSRGLVRAC